jgi:hypothetical protein
MRKYLLIFLWVTISSFANANDDLEITRILQQEKAFSSKPLPQRIEKISQFFLGRQYLMNPLGEGAAGIFDQDPLYRSDAFDCLTYVATVLALAHAQNLSEFQQILSRLNYNSGKIDFFHRNHFVSVDWNIHNQQQHYVQDITAKIYSEVLIANAKIDKPNWYRHLKIQNLKQLETISTEKTQKLLTALHAHAVQEKPIESHLDYIPLEVIFDSKKMKSNRGLLDSIPTGTIIEIVEANKDLTKKIGTHLNVSHMGFAIRTSQGLMFREASSSHHQVVDVPLKRYLLAFYQKDNPHLTGINLEQPL